MLSSVSSLSPLTPSLSYDLAGLTELFTDVARNLLGRDLTAKPQQQKITQEGLKKPVPEKSWC